MPPQGPPFRQASGGQPGQAGARPPLPGGNKGGAGIASSQLKSVGKSIGANPARGVRGRPLNALPSARSIEESDSGAQPTEHRSDIGSEDSWRSGQPHEQLAAEVPPLNLPDVTGQASARVGKSKRQPEQVAMNPGSMARRGEVLLQRLNAVGSAHTDLLHHFEAQARSIADLEAWSRAQQLLLVKEEQEKEALRQQLAAAVAEKQDAVGHMQQLQTELRELRERLGEDRVVAEEQLRKSEIDRAQREGERDEARQQLQELRLQLAEFRRRSVASTTSGQAANTVPPGPPLTAANLAAAAAAAAAPVQNSQAQVASADGSRPGTRLAGASGRHDALEMELNIARMRVAKEASAREAAEKAAEDAGWEQKRLHSELDEAIRELRRLKSLVTERDEVIAFREEVCRDLQARLQQQQVEADQRLNIERGRFQAISRLEGVLPRGVLMKALG